MSDEFRNDVTLYQNLELSEEYGSILKFDIATTEVTTTAAADVTAAGLIPAEATVFAVGARVTTALTGPASWDLGITGDTDLFGTGLALTAGTTVDGSDYDAAWTGPKFYQAATDVIVTNDGVTPFVAGGKVRIVVYYAKLTAPTA